MGKKLIVGENDFQTWCLQNDKQTYLDEWDYASNDLKPDEIAYGSTRKVNWICSQGHKYQETVNERTHRGRGCPYCSGHRVFAGFNDLRTWCLQNNHNNILNEWDYGNNDIKPTEITHGSGRKINWICPQGHKYSMTIHARTNKGSGCPYCSSNRVLVGHNDLQTWCKQNNKQNLLDEWDYENNDLKPTNVIFSTSKKAYWICSQGHQYQTVIRVRTVLGCGCPYCSGLRLRTGVNDLHTWCMQNNRIDILAEWDYEKNKLDITKISRANNKKVHWICSKGHKWQATVSSRTSSGTGCPYCSGHKILVGFNSLRTWCISNEQERLLDDWDALKNADLTPDMVTFGTRQKVWWKCKHGHEWQASIVNRTRRMDGCPKCSANGTSLSEQGIAFYMEKVCRIKQRIKIAGKEIDVYLPEYGLGIEYDGIYYHTERTKRRETDKDMKVSSAGVKLIRIKESDKNFVDDNIIYFVADGRTLGKNYEWAICRLCESLVNFTGNSIFSSIEVNVQRDILSIYEKLDRYYDENSLAKQCPDLVREWHPIKNGTLVSEMFTKGSDAKVWWQCSKGHEWQARINSRVHGGGCPICSGRRVLEGYNDLATVHPELLKEWDYAKNGLLKPSAITSCCGKKVWLKCSKCGLEWQTYVHCRTRSGCGCPKCRIKDAAVSRVKKQLLEVGSLADKFPEIAKDWHPTKNGNLTPYDVSSRSRKRVYWLCPAGHEYQKMVYVRVGYKGAGNGTGCPYCK